MNDLFDGVIYAGIDTDKHKYPIGKLRSGILICAIAHSQFFLHTYFVTLRGSFGLNEINSTLKYAAIY